MLILARSGVIGNTESEAFLARTSGLDNKHVSAYRRLIVGLVDDGVWPMLDMLHIYATQDRVTARLNLVQNSFNATEVGSPGFGPDAGYQGVNAVNPIDYLDTGYIPSVHSQTNNAHVSQYTVVGSRSTLEACGTVIGALNLNGYGTEITPWTWTTISANLGVYQLNSLGSSTGAAGVATRATGFQLIFRNVNTGHYVYRNGTLYYSGTLMAVGTMPPVPVFVLCKNSNGTAIHGSDSIVAAASLGKAMDEPQTRLFEQHLNTYLLAIYGAAP